MATLSKHGAELARFEYATYNIAVFSDGHILKNSGSGWKLFRKAKPGVDPMSIAEQRRNSFNKRRELCPNLDRYVRLLRREVCLKSAWMLHSAIELMPGDPDGVWSTMDDNGVNIDLETIVELCSLFILAEAEVKVYLAAKKAEKKI